LVIDDLNKIATANDLNGLERIKKIHLTTTAFTTENDLATPTMKVRRQ